MAFLYPSFLWALAAIAIPIVLHLIQLRRAKRVEFSNVKFIQVSKDLTASQRNLKEILILISRILFIVFLVLAFAQPFIPASDTATASDNSQVSIVIDNSLSMQNLHAEEDLPLLAVASDRAKRVLDLFPAGAAVSVNANANQSQSALVDAAIASEALDLLEYSNRPMGASFVNRSQRAPSFEHVFVFSDFQRSSFDPAIISRLDSNRFYHFVPIQAASAANVFVDSVFLTDEFIRPDIDGQLHVRLYNAGEKVLEDAPLKLVIDGEQVAALSIDLPAQQVTEATIGFKFKGQGPKKASIELEDYPVEFDNTYYFVLAPSGSLSIAEITPNANSPLQRLYSRENLFQTVRYTPGNIDFSKLGTSDLVVLQGLDEIPAALVSNLSQYVQKGGSLVLIPGSAGQTSSYTALMQALSISASYTAPFGNSSKTSLAPPDKDSPFFQSIFSDYDPKMQMPAAVRSLAWSRASDDIIKFRGGSPFLSRFDRGQGQVYLMAAPLDERYNELMQHALFVPVMYRMAISSYKQDTEIAHRFSGSTISLSIPENKGKEGIFKLSKDSLEFIPDQQIRGGKLYFNVPPDLDEAGFYELRHNNETVATFAFNHDRQESLLEQYSPADLKSFVGSGLKNVHVYDYGDSFSVKGEFEKRFFGVTLWKYCLILCLIFLMAEIALIRFL